jgi:hypothetical protein
MRTNGLGYALDYAHQCAAWTINNQGPARKQCGLPVNMNIAGWIYLCNRHYEIIFREFEAQVDNLNSVRAENLRERAESAERIAEIVQEGISHRHLMADAARFEHRRKEQTVYFIRCQQFVKIGISKNPAARLLQIRRGGGSHFPRLLDVETSELVTTEVGGRKREQELHAQFAHLRHTGEWFTEAPELTEYIESLSERKVA